MVVNNVPKLMEALEIGRWLIFFFTFIWTQQQQQWQQQKHNTDMLFEIPNPSNGSHIWKQHFVVVVCVCVLFRFAIFLFVSFHLFVYYRMWVIKICKSPPFYDNICLFCLQLHFLVVEVVALHSVRTFMFTLPLSCFVITYVYWNRRASLRLSYTSMFACFTTMR